MALTQEDLLAIGNLLETKLAPIKTDVADLKDDVGTLKTDVAGLKDDVGELRSDVVILKDDVGVLPVKRTMKNNNFFSVSLLTGWRYFYAAFNVSS